MSCSVTDPNQSKNRQGNGRNPQRRQSLMNQRNGSQVRKSQSKRDAAWDAAWDAKQKFYRGWFNEMVEAAFAIEAVTQ